MTRPGASTMPRPGRVATWRGLFRYRRPARSRPASRPAIDLDALTDEIQQAGLRLPVLVRFTDILGDRIAGSDAFAAAHGALAGARLVRSASVG